MIQRRWVSVGTYVICLGILLVGIGCGGSGAHVAAISGKVKLDGHPLERGSILLASLDGEKRSVTSAEIVDGEYRLAKANGPAIGKNRVEIRAVRKSGKMVLKPMSPTGEMIEATEEAVAPRFNTASTLTADVKPGDNTANFEVESK